MTRLNLDWRSLEPPRSPDAVLAEGVTARGLAEGATRRLAAGADLRTAVGDGLLLVLGAAQDLPWAPGATYLAVEHGVLLPTTMTPTLPVSLLASAVSQLLNRRDLERGQVALLPGRVLTFVVSDTPTDAVELRRRVGEVCA